MRIANIVWVALVGAGSVTTALADEPDLASNQYDNYCCCCDSSLGVISCTSGIQLDDCTCSLEPCLENAPTVWAASLPDPRTTPKPGKPCCCCDISIPAISCKLQPEEDGCICALVVCPPNVPTLWPTQTPSTPRPTPTPKKKKKIECCCCDTSIPAISCSLHDEIDGCFCTAVECPPNVPTIWPSQPVPTSFNQSTSINARNTFI